MNNKNIIDSIQKFNSECFDAILTHKPMVVSGCFITTSD